MNVVAFFQFIRPAVATNSHALTAGAFINIGFAMDRQIAMIKEMKKDVVWRGRDSYLNAVFMFTRTCFSFLPFKS